MYLCVQMAGMPNRSEWAKSDYRLYCFSVGVCVWPISFMTCTVKMWVFQQEKCVYDYKTNYFTP